MEFSGYDLIGDVHGCARTLQQLLQRLGYQRRGGCYRHPQRQAIFIGDIVDRGTGVREALELVREMVEQGAAQIVLGNHEYNCIAYNEPARPGSQHQYLRDHSPRNQRMLRETLEQMEPYADEWRDHLRWFRQIPLFLDLEGFRVVHACWDEELIQRLKQQQIQDLSDDDFLHRTVERGSFGWLVADRLLRGTYLRLPNEAVMESAEGFRRYVYRTKFWSRNPQRHGDVVFQPDPLPEHLARLPLTEGEREKLLHYGSELPPLFIGHYWRQGIPAPITNNIACLDYSAVKAGRLVAYRMDAETVLSADKFVWVDVDARDLAD
ncbi:serine/threonine protein phosphatase [Motiliproteus coralliicola]|uniref:Serine/threonine protein phosphatase n=1 Tax=Motiliproteus coralliicola TaxID=2283196 RepID=A0A369WPY2_9GAMM|nr:metallophosphoesterase [Motiliproteus coralliicola]RDE24148.1 serine/threonine protein phosphatase [Motiliproteus coralliicola]